MAALKETIGAVFARDGPSVVSVGMAPLMSRMVRALDHDYSAALTLGAGLLVALLWSAVDSNSYQRVLNATWPGHLVGLNQIDSLHNLAVSGFMTIFFFAIGLELSRELASGAFTKPSHALPPVMGALGGMLGTALLSILAGGLTNTSALRHGWGVPMATDIAFTLGALALAGRGLPPTLRLFLLMLAVADDVFSVVVLAWTGATHVRAIGLGAIVIVVIAVRWSSRRFHSTPWRLGVLVALWLCFVAARVEPPLAGVVAGLVVPFDHSAGLRLEDHVRRWSTGLVLPLFALVSCGLRWSALSGHTVTVIVFATIAIRVAGKVVGVTGGVALARLLGYRLHPSITWPLLATSALLCAIGFTVPLLFAGALFQSSSPTYGAFTLGLLLSSLLSGVLGVALLKLQSRRH